MSENNVDFRTVECVATKLVQMQSILYFITEEISRGINEDEKQKITNVLFWLEDELQEQPNKLYKAIGL